MVVLKSELLSPDAVYRVWAERAVGPLRVLQM
jgi:hypothetical protein